MKVVPASLLPPVGPFWVPTASSVSQAIAVGSTVTAPFGECTFAQTALVSLYCHVARIAPLATTFGSVLGSAGLGLGLKKWVIICLPSSPNRVASGVKST